VHAAAWKRLFDEYLCRHAEREGTSFQPFDIPQDYERYVDGKPRYDGVQSFLAYRGISLPFGSPDDPSDRETVCGLGNRKNGYFLDALKEGRRAAVCFYQWARARPPAGRRGCGRNLSQPQRSAGA
jgi:hypothetical protein